MQSSAATSRPPERTRAAEAIPRLRRHLAGLPPHVKLEECSKAVVLSAPYRDLAPEPGTPNPFVLDMVNFSRRLFRDPLPLRDLLGWFDVEPGYGTLTGDLEVGGVVRQLERQRAAGCAAAYGLDRHAVAASVDRAAVAVTTGATGGVQLLLAAVLAEERQRGGRRAEIVFPVPTFCLADAFARQHGLVPHPVGSREADGFLPALDAVRAACTDGTLACVLTYPANPAQTSWGRADAAAFRRLIDHCQAKGILLVADTIFQDLRWSGEEIPEPFALADSPSHLAKVWSPSKDRPFACGYRVGYVLCDPALEPRLEEFLSLNTNSCGTVVQLWLGFECTLRVARRQGGLSPELFEPLRESHAFGYGASSPPPAAIARRLRDAGAFETYAAALDEFERIVDDGLDRIARWLAQSPCFAPAPRGTHGNILMVRVRPPFDFGDENLYFLETLAGAGVTALVGGCFGMPADAGVWFRIVVGGSATGEVIAALERVERFLLRRFPRL